MSPKNTRIAAWWGALVLLVSAAVYVYNVVERMEDRNKVAKMTAKMQTVCVGRFLIDLPANAAYYINGAYVGGFRVTWMDESHEQFAARVSAREAEINAQPNALGHKNLELVKAVDANGFNGKIFMFGRNSSYTIERDVRQVWEDVKLEGYVNANGKSFNFIADGYDPAKTNNLNKLIALLRVVPDRSIPTVPGFCFGPGMLLDPVSAEMAEKVVLFAGLPGYPDIAIAFNTMAGLKSTSPGLLERRAKTDADQPAWVRARFAKLRSGARTINGLAGEEAVVKVTETNFRLVYGFDWELAGTEDDVLAPAIHLEMSSGNNPKPGGPPVQSGLGQQALLELWDTIASSVRVRPTEQTAASDPLAPATSPLGTVATAGEVCPQSGWWLCSEGSPGIRVLGGQRQYMRKGQRMPQALLLPEQSLWQKLRGVQPSFESQTSTAWKLLDKRSRQRVGPTVHLDQARAAEPTTSSMLSNSSAAKHAAIGSCVSTGSPCTTSGWWRCEESQALDGTRWFAKGTLLPAATLMVPAAAPGDPTGRQKPIHRRAMWRLIRIAPAPRELDSGKGDSSRGIT